MATELPIACSLSASDLAARAAQIGELGRDALVDARVDGRRAELRFRGDSRERVETFVAAETECCPFFAMSVDETPGEVRLTIDASAGAEPVLEELVAAFRT